MRRFPTIPPCSPAVAFACLVCAAALAVTITLSLPGCRSERPVVRIGCQQDKPFITGARIALEELSALDLPVELQLVKDPVKNSSHPADVLNSAYGFADDPAIMAVIGYGSSDATIAAARILSEEGIPLLVPGATSPRLLETGEWVFRLCPNDRYQAEFLARVARRRFKAERCALVYQNSDYGRSLRRLFTERFEADGGEVVLQIVAGSGITKQDVLEVYAGEIVDTTPDLLLYICQFSQAENLSRTLEAQGVRIPSLASDSLYRWNILKHHDGTLNGMELALFYHHELPTNGNEPFAERFMELCGQYPNYLGALAHDAVLMIGDACAAGARTRDGIRRHLAGLGNPTPPFVGVGGTTLFNEFRESPRPMHLGVLRNGRIELLPSP